MAEAEDVFGYADIEVPTVVGLLKNILSQYPDNGQIIKELVQNAEDAGASKVDVVHDTRSLEFPEAHQDVQRFIRGPALCLYNDAVFSEEDWNGIRKLSDSIKKDDPLRVGQFGLGFKSVFHITDYITIISGSKLLFMDPSERVLFMDHGKPPVNRMCRFVSLSDLGKVFPEAFALQLWGTYLTSQHILTGTFPATLFWFPLRQQPSQLSSTVYTKDSVRQLFDSFSVEAPICLTFLRALEQVSLQRVERDPKTPVLVHQVGYHNDGVLDVRQKRKDLRQILHQCEGRPSTSVTSQYQVTIHNTKDGQVNKQTMLVLHYLPGQQDKYCIKYKGNEPHRYIPLVGVAVPTQPIATPGVQGSLFTFLPLPLDPANATGLPVQVNAYFTLDQNRRHVKWRTHESSKEPDVIWNEELVSEVVLEAYHKLLLYVHGQTVQGIYQPQMWYSVLPHLGTTTARWHQLATQLWRKILSLPILHSQTHGFLTTQNVITDVSLHNYSNQVNTCIKKVLQCYRKPLVTLPSHVTISLDRLNCTPPTVTPELIRECLRSGGGQVKCVCDTITLLEYITSDQHYHNQLNGLQLLPLNDGSWSSYSNSSNPIYICTSNEAAALWGLQSYILQLDLPSVLRSRLDKVALLGTTQLVQFNATQHGLHLLTDSVNRVQRERHLSGLQLQDWLQQVWSLLQQMDLNTITHLPLLPSCPSPTSSTNLLSLSSPIIVQNLQCPLPNSTIQTLQLLDIKVVTQLPHYVRHHQLHPYLYSSDGSGVNKALSKMISISTIQNIVASFNDRSSNVEHEALINAIDLNTLQPDVKIFLAKLNIFISVGECGNTKNDCVKRVMYIIPRDLVDFPVHFPVAILKHQTTRHQQLAITLGAELLSKEKLCLLALSSSNTYSESEISKLALYILSDNNLMTNISICQWLKTLRFVSDVNGVLHLPGELYDPRDGDIDALIDEDLTPGSHRFHQYLPALVKLGLKKIIDLPQHLLIQVITHVQSPSINTEEKTRKSLALLRVLEQRQDFKAVCMAVRDVAFVYGVTVKPSDYPVHLGWETKPHLLTPTSLKSYSKYKDVLGSVIQLVDCSHLPKVANGFNWNMDPDTSKFCDHFRNMITAYQYSTQGCFEMSKKIYKYLSKIIKSSDDHNLECLSDLPCVFTEYGFKFSHQVFLQPAVDDVKLLPYIYPLPYELREWNDLFEFLGCFVNQSKDLYLKFIKDVQDYHNTDAEGNVHQDRKMVVSVLEKLDKFVNDIPPSELLLPVENDDDALELVKKELCSYSDQHCNWLTSDDLEVRIVHKCISFKLAQSLGVKQLSQHLLLGGESMMEWGQNEPLTTSLNNLLRQYRDGVAIMKELVQNADDAGATTVSFLYDERQNEDARTRLLSPQLEQWQGPALWAYNDATFTEDDFKNLRKLGGGTKELQSTKIGKFGFGFCSVYNLTDVPSFVSGSSYVIFDPHLEYLGHENKTPGLRYSFEKEKTSRLLSKLHGQFKPFNEMFDCAFQDTKEYDGTLFRFPLRTPLQASKSQICKISYGRTDMMQLLHMFWKVAGQILLFAQNVKEIKVFHLASNASTPTEMKLLFESSSVPLNEPLMNKVKKSPLKKVNSLFREHSGFQWNGKVYQDTTIVNINVKSFPEGKDICDNKVGSESVTWITSWHSGKGRLCRLAEKLSGKALPLGAVSTPVCQDSSGWKPICLKDLPSGFYKESHMHCFLPLPVKTSLPIQVNGYFEIASDRTALLSQTSDDRQNLSWNSILIEDAISSAYLTLLQKLISLGQNTEVPYYTLWPLATDGNNDLITTLITSFYHLLVEEKWQIFYSNDGWHPLIHCLFLEDNFYQKQIGKVAFEYMENILASSNKQHLIELPTKIQAGFQNDLLSKFCISQYSFYTNYFIPTISNDIVSSEMRDDLTLHMIDHVDTCVKSLQGIASIPTHPYGKLRDPRDLIYPQGQVAKMYSESDERFPQDKFTQTSDRCRVLLNLGMKSKTVSAEWVKERACNVVQSVCSQCALHRSREILYYMAMQDEEEQNTIASKIQTLPFLPVMNKPLNWQYAWKGDEHMSKQSKLCSSHTTSHMEETVTFTNPSDLYSSHFKELVGSTELILRPIQSRNRHKVQESVLNKVGVTVDYLPLESVIEQLVVFSNAPPLDKIHARCHAIYEYLEEVLKCQPTSASELHNFQNKNILLTKKHGFVEPSLCALSSEHDCAPDLFSASIEGLDKYKLLMTALDITTNFSFSVVEKKILSKKEAWGEEKLSDEAVSQVSKLVDELYKVSFTTLDNNKVQMSSQSLHLPDTRGYLQPVNKLCFDDGSKLSSGNLLCMHHNFKVSKDMLKWLGIVSKTQKRLEGSSHRMHFGQNEPLTTRLRNILQDYPYDSGIMKELLQNADDAGATEVAFIIDLRHLPTDTLFDKKYAPLQGPSLSVYNNKGFTANDLKSIQDLGNSTKKEDPTSTGQYGIGFNAVYHLTDAPSFLTKGPDVPEGSTICMFDPHCRYDPSATVEAPGVRFTNLDELRKDHPDSFMGYLETKFLQTEGTVFRLPLRSSADSDISKNVVAESDLRKLVQEFQSEMSKCMLFLRSVRKASVVRIDETGKWHEDYSVKSKVSKQVNVLSSILCRKKQSNNTNENLYAPEMVRDSYKMQITDSTEETSNWIIVQQVGAHNKESVPDIVKEAFHSGSLRLLPHASVALLLNTNIQNIKSLFTTSCYLPLPAASGLPFSVNGHFALSSSRRDLWSGTGDCKALWNQWLMKEVLVPVAVHALDYCRLNIFQNTSNYLNEFDYRSMIYSFQKRLPEMNDMKSAKWKCFTKWFYEHVKDNGIPFFDVFIPERDKVQENSQGFRGPMYSTTTPDQPLNGHLQWHPLTEPASEFPVYFLHHIFNKPNILNTLKRLGMKISSDVMCCKLESADPEYQYQKLTPTSALNFLTSWNQSFPDNCKPQLEKVVEKTPFLKAKNVLDLFQYISHELTESSSVVNLPLLLTNDNVLRPFTNSKPVFISKYCSLLPNLGGEFVNRNMVIEIEQHVNIFKEACVVKPFTTEDLRDHLPSVLDSSHQSDNAMIKLTDLGNTIPNKLWLKNVWSFVTNNCLFKFSRQEPTTTGSSVKVNWEASKEYILQTLGDWALYPVTVAGITYLVSINNAWRSLDMCGFDTNSPFRVLPIPEPCPYYQDKDIIPAELKLSATENEPPAVLEVVYFHKNEISDYITKNQQNQSSLGVGDILEYLGRHCSKHSLCKEKISQLQIFINASGQHCSIFGRHIIIPMSVDLAYMNQIALENGYVILKQPSSTYIECLYKYIHPKYLSQDLDIYSEFILPNLEYLEEPQRMSYLETLKAKLTPLYHDSKNKQPEVVSVLRNTRFIQQNGRLQTANNFYDPSNLVFSVMKVANLPQKWNYSWNYFLRMAGMIYEVTPNKYLEFARSLEASDPDVKAKSEVLIQHLETCYSDMKSVTSDIEDIEFLVPYNIDNCLNVDSILPCFKTTSGLVSISQCVHSKYQYVVWSTVGILPEYAANGTLLTQLNISGTPPEDKVLQHITNFCDVCSRAKCNVNEEVMESIYEYLMTQSNICDNLKQKDVPVVHIPKHRVFVSASQVMENLEDEILPYLYKAPTRYGKYYDVFKMMGMNNQANCDTYAQVLTRIYQCNMQQELHPEEMHRMIMALNGMLKCNLSLQKLTVDALYLPTQNLTLRKSTEMFVADNDNLLRAVRSQLKEPLFLGFDALKINWDNGDFVKRLPERLRPKFVSQIVQENLVIDGVQETFSPMVGQLQESLGSPAFETGILRVINHFKVKESVGMSSEEQQVIKTKLTQVVVKELKEIKVILKYCDNEVGTKRRRYHLQQKDNNNTLYITQDINSNTLQQALSSMYSNLLNFKTIEEHKCLNIIFGCIMKPHDIHKQLDEHDIMESGTQDFHCKFYSTDVGSYLDERFLHLLDNSFGDFNDGEIVCMKKYVLEDYSDEKREDESEEDNTFVIVKVLRLVEESCVCKMINIYEVSRGSQDPTLPVKAYRLYRFVRPVSNTVVPFTGTPEETEQERTSKVTKETEQERTSTMTEEELRKQIRKQVIEIWQVENEKDRKSLLRRLMFQWHPDKNPDREEMCTRLFQYIRSLVGRLERGETIPEEDTDSNSAPGPSQTYDHTFRPPPPQYTNPRRTFGGSSERFASRPGGRSQGRRRMGDQRESRKWWSHAGHDLEVAERHLAGIPPCYTIYFCLQAAGKFLKACLYQVDRDTATTIDNIDSLTNLCHLLNLPHTLEQLVNEVMARVGGNNGNGLRFPADLLVGCPCDRYSSQDATFVLEKVNSLKELLVPDFYN
ncbi:hypothetical protein Pmani_013712 [Petrolisthes manimaculis]|uniref:Sacsin/Nov domain-containing protein n=1 Tax=Petrolisthes manimaculis TaxID=1843537 RepID=A0AAE1PVU8_9EUCA|nr:hypothetical protein Pmani_013712 [Petrolisthes manimaculis]